MAFDKVAGLPSFPRGLFGDDRPDPFIDPGLGIQFDFINLPVEAQRDVIKHASWRTLVSLQRVSSHLHSLASAELYAHLRFFLSNGETFVTHGKRYYRMSEVLHVLATSEHDYAQYVRSFSAVFAVRDLEDFQRMVASKYHVEEDANKLLNTLLLLMLRKTKYLEVFRWGLPIELGSPVYNALAKIQSLQHFGIRIDANTVPRSAPFNSYSTLSVPPPLPPGLNASQFTAPSNINVPWLGPSGTNIHSHSIPPMPKIPSPIPKLLKSRFSSLKDLRTIEVLGISDMQSLEPIALCMKASSMTLKSVAFSLSPSLARKARKPPSAGPPMGTAIEILDDEDDDITLPDGMLPGENAAPVVNEADIMKERAVQESILAKIFCLEPISAEDTQVNRKLKSAASKLRTKEDHGSEFLRRMQGLIKAMSSTTLDKANSKKFLDDVDKAVKQYTQTGSKSSKSGTKKASKAPKPNKKISPYSISTATSNSPTLKPGKVSYNYGDPFDIDSALLPELQSFTNGTGLNGSAGGFLHSSSSSQYPHLVPAASSLGTVIQGDPYGASHHPYPPGFANIASMGTVFPSASSANGIPPFPSYAAPPKVPGIYAPGSGGIVPSNKSKYPSHKSIFGPGKSNAAKELMQQLEQWPDSSSESEEPDPSSGSSAVHEFSSAEATQKDAIDDMGVDMDHPSVVDSDSERSDEGSVASETEQNSESQTSLLESFASTSKSTDNNRRTVLKNNEGKASVRGSGLLVRSSKRKILSKVDRSKKVDSTEQTMQDYLRKTHGFRIERLALYLTPLKPSVLGRALDFSHLQHLTLLSVGGQGALWVLMLKIHTESAPLTLKTVLTDDVSMAFLKCIGQVPGLEGLYMLRRNSKDSDCTTNKSAATLDEIRTMALRKHMPTLKKLSLQNNEDASWDLDERCLRLLSAKGAALTELAFSVDIASYHFFLQCLPSFKNLIAMNVYVIRSPERLTTFIRECRKFLLDSILHHYSKLKLRYVAVGGVVNELSNRPKPPSISRRRTEEEKQDRKGKQKAVASDPSTDADDSADYSDIETKPADGPVLRHLKFWETHGVDIFRTTVRTGKL